MQLEISSLKNKAIKIERDMKNKIKDTFKISKILNKYLKIH